MTSHIRLKGTALERVVRGRLGGGACVCIALVGDTPRVTITRADLSGVGADLRLNADAPDLALRLLVPVRRRAGRLGVSASAAKWVGALLARARSRLCRARLDRQRMKLNQILGRVVLIGSIFTALWALFLVSLVPGEPVRGVRAPFRSARDLKLAALALGKQAQGGGGGEPEDALAYPAEFKIYISPRPSPLPLPDIFDLRNCVCRDDWKTLLGTDESLCTCNGKACGNHVNPRVRVPARMQAVGSGAHEVARAGVAGGRTSTLRPRHPLRPIRSLSPRRRGRTCAACGATLGTAARSVATATRCPGTASRAVSRDAHACRRTRRAPRCPRVTAQRHPPAAVPSSPPYANRQARGGRVPRTHRDADAVAVVVSDAARRLRAAARHLGPCQGHRPARRGLRDAERRGAVLHGGLAGSHAVPQARHDAVPGAPAARVRAVRLHAG